jgi:transposase, IS30 family
MGRRYRHLSLEERVVIETQLGLGMVPKAIARGLGRAPTTILRELRRNSGKAGQQRGRPYTAGRYQSLAADRRARRLAAKPRVQAKMARGTPLWECVLGHLRQSLSPGQIARTLARMPEPIQLSYETIYNSLYAMPRGHLRSEVMKLMRRRHHVRRPQRGNKGPRKPPIPEMDLIDQRPAEAEHRLIPGHWEGDLIIGKANRSQIGVLVDRKSLFLALVKLDSTRPDHVAPAFAQILNRFDSQLRRSLTFDQGSEMRHYQRLQHSTGIHVYFAHPHSPWERGICENTNGLLRQYFPRGTDLSIFSQNQLDDIAWKMNARIRKSLGWKAPAEVFLPEGAFDFVKYWSFIAKPVALGT